MPEAAVNHRAHVIRHQPMIDERYAGVALQFAQPLDLGLNQA